jgi:hypothetical protein
MTQFVLLILPEVEGEQSRAVGPFLAEHLAHSWGNVRGIARSRRLVWPLEPVNRSVYGQGRHALIPTPGPRGGIAGVLADAIGPPPLPEPIPARSISVAPMTAGRPITKWITEEGMALEPNRVVAQATNTGLWKGTVARFGIPTLDGRGLEIGDDWLPHFVRMPVPLIVPTLDGPRVVGVAERVHVEDDKLEAEGRISFDELAAVAPELVDVFMRRSDEALYEWPAGVNVQNGHVSQDPGGARVDGPWELASVVISSTPIWPDCSIRVESINQSGKLLP